MNDINNDNKIIKPYIVGIGCKALTGKDTFIDMLNDELTSLNYFCLKYSLANPLKEELNEFLLNNFNISAFTQNSAEKEIVRGIMVEVGKTHRKLTAGRHFTRMADFVREMNSFVDFFLVPDIRFAEYGDDEVDWLKKNNGYFIYLDRILDDGSIVQPANDTERINSRNIIKKYRDYYHYYLWNSFSNDFYKNQGKNLVKRTAQDILKYFNLI